MTVDKTPSAAACWGASVSANTHRDYAGALRRLAAYLTELHPFNTLKPISSCCLRGSDRISPDVTTRACTAGFTSRERTSG